MYFRNMFYDRKAKAGSACFAGPAFVDPVESFKDPFLLIFRNAYACILDREERMMILLAVRTRMDPFSRLYWMAF